MNKTRQANALLVLAITFISLSLSLFIAMIYIPSIAQNRFMFIVITILLLIPISAIMVCRKLYQNDSTKKLYLLLAISYVSYILLTTINLLALEIFYKTDLNIIAYSNLSKVIQYISPITYVFVPLILCILILIKERPLKNPMMNGILVFHILVFIQFLFNKLPLSTTIQIVDNKIYQIIYPVFFILAIFLWALGAINIALKVRKQEITKIILPQTK